MGADHLPPHPMGTPYGAADQGERQAVSLADTLLAAALWYARQGWGIFPCKPGRKVPATIHGFQDAVGGGEERIRAWFGGRPYNIAVSTGYPGPDVLDIDVRADGTGWPAFHRLKAAGLLAGAFMITRTRRRPGAHIFYAGTSQRCGRLKAEHLDFKATGGYVLLPPSYVTAEHTDDGIAGGYELVDHRAPTGATFDWEAAKQLLCPPRPAPVRGQFRHGPGSARHLVAWLEGEFEGNRNSGLFWAACRALEAGDEQVIDDLAAVATGAGLGEDAVRKTIDSAYRTVTSDGR
jgi:hypothetical protein